jgi:CDGSH-type Zn-finger protein
MACEVKIKDNGPIIISGDFVIKDASDRVFDVAGRKVIGLCRCGQSENKPFCDGKHRACGFDSAIEARILPPPASKPK